VTLRNGDLGGALDGPTSATIKFEVPLLDHGLRDVLRANSDYGRKGAARISDMGFRSLVLAPYALDVGLGALILHRNLDVAAQLALIDFEVLTLAGLTQLLGSRVLGRARPYVSECAPEGCSGGPYRSFLSGHAMASFTAAGLICVHHKFMPIFGGGATDTWACVWALTAASLTGTFRIVADEHWASDVLIGAGLGWIYGYYLPQLLHFHAKKSVSKGKDAGVTWMPTLTGTTDSGVLGVLGTF
jgi:membrane-associated phospholipid phosphatase